MSREFLCVRAVTIIFAALLIEPSVVNAGIFRNSADLAQSEAFAQQSVFDGVGLFTGDDANGGSFIAGSGVFIGNGPDGQNAWVLTAAHVLYDEPFLRWDSMQFNPSANVGENLDNFLDVEDFFTFPDYFGNVGGGIGNDIGLAKLSNPILDILPAARFFGSDSDLLGTEFVVAGYGNPGTFGSQLGNFDGIRRGGRNTIDSAGASFGVTTVEEQFFVSDFDQFNFESPLPLEWQGSMNDSGSPWFVDVNGEYQIAGIVNGGLTSNTSTFALRTAIYNDWVDNTIQVNSTAVPEPGALVILALFVAGRAVRRTRTGGINHAQATFHHGVNRCRFEPPA